MVKSKKNPTKRIVKWVLLLAVLAGTNYGTIRLVTLIDERDDRKDNLETCQLAKCQAVIDKINLENEVLRPLKTPEL